MPFNTWLTTQVDRDDDVGLIARFAVRGVRDWPRDRHVKLATLRLYLRCEVGFWPAGLRMLDDALVRARDEWRAERWPDRAAA